MTSNWLVAGGYALQKAEVTETTAAAPKGREVPLVPRHSFSLWNRYDFNDRFGAGLGVIARSKSFATISNAVTLPGYARVDAALYYKLPHGLEAQVNVENLVGRALFPDRERRQQYRARRDRARSRRASGTASSERVPRPAP